jgi:hypothetical protein
MYCVTYCVSVLWIRVQKTESGSEFIESRISSESRSRSGSSVLMTKNWRKLKKKLKNCFLFLIKKIAVNLSQTTEAFRIQGPQNPDPRTPLNPDPDPQHCCVRCVPYIMKRFCTSIYSTVCTCCLCPLWRWRSRLWHRPKGYSLYADGTWPESCPALKK